MDNQRDELKKDFAALLMISSIQGHLVVVGTFALGIWDELIDLDVLLWHSLQVKEALKPIVRSHLPGICIVPKVSPPDARCLTKT